MRPKGSAAVLEARRHHAWALLEDGLSLNAVARRLGCAPARSSGGATRSASVARTGSGWTLAGAPPKLTPRSGALGAPAAAGTAGGRLPDQSLDHRAHREVIRRQFHVRYHPDHVGRLLHALHWSAQKPDTRALERDDAPSPRGRPPRGPGKKNAARLGATSSPRRIGLPADATVRKTWARGADAGPLGGQVKTGQLWTSENRPPRAGGRDGRFYLRSVAARKRAHRFLPCECPVT